MASAELLTVSPNSGGASSLATVFVVDDDADNRRSLSLLIRSDGVHVEAFDSARRFLESYQESRAGCLVLDLRMPDMSGLELQRLLNQRGSQLPIVFVSAYGEVALVSEALRAGALDFLQKPYSPQTMLERIHEAIDRDRKQRRYRAEHRQVEVLLARLSDREREVMQLLADGMTTKTIASRLEISPKTVDNHRARIYEKLQVESAATLATLVLRHCQS